MIGSARTGLTLKAEQIRCAMALTSGHDVTLVAATGFGKSVVYQIAIMMIKEKFGLVVTPINALGEDQVKATIRNNPVSTLRQLHPHFIE